MTIYIKKTGNILWKTLLLLALVFNSSCATEEAEDLQITDNETPDKYAGLKKVNLKNAESSVSSGTTYYIRNKNSGKVLDLQNYGKDIGDRENSHLNVYQWECHGDTNQQWKVDKVNGNFRFLCLANSYYLEIKDGSSSSEANLQTGLIAPPEYKRQQFQIIRKWDGSTQFYIKNLNSGKVLDVANYSKSNGGNVYQYAKQSSNNNNQLWEFYKVSDY